MSFLLHTVRERLLSVSAVVLLVGFAGTCVYAAVAGTIWRAALEASLEEVEAKADEYREKWFSALAEVEAGTTDSPYAARPMSLPFAATLPLGALADFSFAREDLLPRSAIVNGWDSEATLFTGHEIQAPSSLVYGRVDLTFCALVLWPLLLVILSFGALNRERTSGRLPLLVVHGVSPLKLVAYRVGAVAVSSWLLLSLVAWASAVSVSAPGRMSAFAQWWVGVSVYGLIWTFIVMAVVSVPRSSALEGIAGLATWALLVVVLPSTSQGLASGLYPPPSQVDLLSRTRYAQADTNRNLEARVEAFMSGHTEAVETDSAVPGYYRASYLANREARLATAEIRAAHEASSTAQREFMRGATVVSPVSAVFADLSQITGSGPRVWTAYRRQVGELFERVQAAIGPATVANARLTSARARAIAPFRFEPPPVELHVLGWLSWLLLGMVALWLTFRSTRVRLL